MEIKEFLQKISPYVIVNMGFLKRLFPETDLKSLREILNTAINSNQLLVHQYSELRCFSLSREGFEAIEINHSPRLSLTEHQADIICRTNHVRMGFEVPLKSMGIQCQWITGAKFAKSPLFVRVRNNERYITPIGAAVLTDQQAHQKLFIFHEFADLESFQSDMQLYAIYAKKGLYQKRFHLHQEATMRIIVLIPSYKALLQFHRRLKVDIYQYVLFLPLTHVHHPNLLSETVFMAPDGKKVSILRGNTK
jgi:hypothetical protein